MIMKGVVCYHMFVVCALPEQHCFSCLNRTVSGDIRLTTRYNKQGSKLEVIVHQARLVNEFTKFSKFSPVAQLFNRSRSDSHALGFHVLSQKLEPHQNHLVQHDKQHHMKVLLSGFHLHRHT